MWKKIHKNDFDSAKVYDMVTYYAQLKLIVSNSSLNISNPKNNENCEAISNIQECIAIPYAEVFIILK